jgi:flagellar hook-associated protein 1 FlgK
VQADLYAAQADLGGLDKSLDYAKNLAEILDATTTTGDQPTLLGMMTRFEDAWKQLEATPEDNATKALLVQRGIEVATEIRRLNGLQPTLQTRAQSNIESDVESINTASIQIAKLNAQIAARAAGGGESGDLEDLRDAEVAKIADKVGIRTIVNDRGELFVYTEGGTQLVGSVAQQLTYDPTSNTISTAGGSGTLNNGFQSGSIRASLDYLDTSTVALNDPDPNVGMLGKFFNQLDSLAANLVEVVNNAYDDPATAAVEQFFATPTANAEASDIDVLTALKTTPANVDETRAGAVQQAMRTTTLTSTQITRSSTDPNGLSVSNVNIFDLANGVMAYHAKSAADNQSGRDTAERQQATLQQKYKNLTGVNIDDELAQLQVLQNNYAALANVMNTVTQMFDQLVNIGR